MEKVWLQHYPATIPRDIDPDCYRSLVQMFEDNVKKFADKPAYSNLGVTLSYADVEAKSRDFAGFLQSVTGLPKASKIAIMMPNLLQYPIALFGALRAGMTVVNVNPLYTPRELEHQLNDSGAQVIVILANFAHTLAQVIDKTDIKHVVVTQLADACPPPKRWLVNGIVKHVKKMVPPYQIANTVCWHDAMSQGAEAGFNQVDVGPDDIAFLQYTGGTTGVSKGAMLTHRNIVANVTQGLAWTSILLDEGKELIITPLPLYHIFALTVNCILMMSLGAHNVLITNPRDLSGFIKELSKWRFTAITGVNTLFNGLLNTPEFNKLDFSHLKVSLGGGMAVQEAVAKRWQKVTKQRLIEGYGLTETSPLVCCNLVTENYSGTIGYPVSSTDVSIRDEDDKALGFNEPGELCVRGPQVMKGYLNRPEETAKCINAEGWFHTGDIALIMENGQVRIVDRKKDMINVSGFNVYPNEIEAVVVMHRSVQEVAAIGVPSEKTGEAIKLFVVKSDSALTDEDIIEHCRQHLTGYKVPKLVVFRDELPKSNVGKILRRELREEDN